MAFNVHQGGELKDAIQWAYDGVPIVTENTAAGSNTNHVYLCRVSYWTGSGWKSLGTLHSRGNEVGFGVFDIQSVVLAGDRVAKGALQTLETTDTYYDEIQTYAGREWYVKAELGWKSDTQNATYPATRYYRIIAGALTDTFTSWADRNYEGYVLKTTQGTYLTKRKTSGGLGSFVYGNRPIMNVDVMPYDRYSVTYLACSKPGAVAGTTWNSNLGRFEVRVISLGMLLATQTFDVTKESIYVDTQAVPQTANGLLLREVHFGPKDITQILATGTRIYSGTMQGAIALGQWDYIELVPKTSGNATTGNQIVRLHNMLRKEGAPCRDSERLQFKFRNRLGGFDYLSCQTYTKRVMNTERVEHSRRDTNYNSANNVTDIEPNNPHAFTRVSRVSSITDKFTADTGYISEDMNDVVRELLTSQEVYVTKWVDNDTRVNQFPSFYPCLVTSPSMSYMYRVTDKLVQYTFDFEYSNNPRPLI